ncbi:aldo/keto reductase [Cochlodiniinecator piscidefendens]|uniref:aldo/keto reductase n=1 Tax=Cochlodiniinecator piscidefendens TaxID=2715756 RepID=UPI00197C134D|nr:aldo/keto reductase [Cochlodiniinecator piscidefendens]
MTSQLKTAPRIGMGCWAIGGPFWSGNIPVGYSGADDAESTRTVQAAWANGVRVFDTSAVYGAGHSETLLGAALKKRPDAIIISKFGHSFDAGTKQMTGPKHDPAYVRWSIEQSLIRLQRDHIDTMLLHLNGLPVAQARPVFDTLETLRSEGKIRAFGWSTDFWDHLDAIAPAAGFHSVQHSMNLLFDAPSLGKVARHHQLTQLVRSPLGMGVLTGKFSDGATVPNDDVRSNSPDWQGYFQNGQASADYVAQLNAVRELLTTDGKTLAQGALSWLLAKSGNILPLPGAKTVAQAEENAGAIVHGPLPDRIMHEIESILDRPQEGAARAR